MLSLEKKQEIYDKVKAHLLAQGRPAVDASGTCRFRDEAGRRCAIGALFPEDHPILRENGGALVAIRKLEELWGILLDDEATRFLFGLQDIHDGVISDIGNVFSGVPERWAHGLSSFAGRWGLKP
jgi:hypothetical protein